MRRLSPRERDELREMWEDFRFHMADLIFVGLVLTIASLVAVTVLF